MLPTVGSTSVKSAAITARRVTQVPVVLVAIAARRVFAVIRVLVEKKAMLVPRVFWDTLALRAFEAMLVHRAFVVLGVPKEF
jgi:hypothetical protein